MKRALLAAIFLVAFLASAPGAETSSQLKPFGRGSWQEIKRAHAGRPTIVHFWGVTCGPCKVELPLLGQFMKEHGAIDMVTISADLVPNLPAAARAMLEKAGLGSAENWIFDDGFVERLQIRNRPGLAGRDPAYHPDFPQRRHHDDRGLRRNDGHSKMVRAAADRREIRTRGLVRACTVNRFDET